MGNYIRFNPATPQLPVEESTDKAGGAYKALSEAQKIIKDLNDTEPNGAIRRAASQIHEGYTSKWRRMNALQRGVATIVDGLKGAINFLFRTHLSTRHNVEEMYQRVVNRDPIFHSSHLRTEAIKRLQEAMDAFAVRKGIGKNATQGWVAAAHDLGWEGAETGDHFQAQDYVRHLLAGLIWAGYQGLQMPDVRPPVESLRECLQIENHFASSP